MAQAAASPRWSGVQPIAMWLGAIRLGAIRLLGARPLPTRLLATGLVAMGLGGCGGGGAADLTAPSQQATVQSSSIASRVTGTTYALSLYLPPASAGPRKDLPVVYLLDGESWFQTLVGIVDAAHTPVIVVAIQTAGQRNRDFVPANTCTPGGGGHAAYLDFLRQELIPYVEANVGGHPAGRILFGHSHGGSFVFYALLAEAAAAHSFRSYLASDASIACLPDAAAQWERSYAAQQSALPVRVHVSCATGGNCASDRDYADVLAGRRHAGLTLRVQPYAGSHTGIVPQALADGLAFALAAGP